MHPHFAECFDSDQLEQDFGGTLPSKFDADAYFKAEEYERNLLEEWYEAVTASQVLAEDGHHEAAQFLGTSASGHNNSAAPSTPEDGHRAGTAGASGGDGGDGGRTPGAVRSGPIVSPSPSSAPLPGGGANSQRDRQHATDDAEKGVSNARLGNLDAQLVTSPIAGGSQRRSQLGSRRGGRSTTPLSPVYKVANVKTSAL
jgi:hypothetical protein